MNTYSHLKYQSAMAEKLEERRKLPGAKLTLRQLADGAGIQASFLTNVLKARVDFSADQLFAICDFLGFTAAERRYLLLLLEHSRSANRARKQELKQEIDALREEHQKTEKHISIKKVELNGDAMAEYYLDPFVQLAHVHLNLPAYSSAPDKLTGVLGISNDHLKKILGLLTRIGYVAVENGRYKVITGNKHLPKENPLCTPHQSLLRFKSMDQLQRLSAEQRYSFSATLTGNDEAKAEIQNAFLGFLKKAESIVKAAETKAVYQMNFDLFPWQV